METTELEVDAELLEEVRKFLKPYGLTAEELAEQFLCWVAANPEEATAYLREAMANENGNSTYECQSANESK